MTKPFEFGRAIFATAMAGMGVQCLLRGAAVPALEPVTTASALPVIGWITGVVLIAAAVATMLRPTARHGAAVLAATLLLWVVLLHAPALAASPKSGGKWTGSGESFALGGAALVLFGLTRLSGTWRGAADTISDEHADCARDVWWMAARRGVAAPGWRSREGEIAKWMAPLE
jgi:hypothetical protein